MRKLLVLLFCFSFSTVVFSQKKAKNKKNKSKHVEVKVPVKEELQKVPPRMIIQQGHKSVVDEMHVSPDGKLLVTYSKNDQLCKLWDIHIAKEIKTFKKDTSFLVDMKVSLDGKYVIQTVGSDKVYTKLIDIQSGEEVFKDRVHEKKYHHTEVIPNTTFLVHFDYQPVLGNFIFITDIKKKSIVKKFDAGEQLFFFKISPDGSLLYGMGTKTIYVWDVKTGGLLQKVKKEAATSESDNPEVRHRELPFFTANNKYLIWDDYRKVKYVDVLTGVENILIESLAYNDDIAFSPSMDKYAVRDYETKKTTLYSFPENSPLSNYSSEGFVYNLELDESSKFIIERSYSNASVFDKSKNKLQKYRATDFLLIPNSDYAIIKLDTVYNAPSYICLVDLNTGRKLKEYKGIDSNTDFAKFSKNGKLAAWVVDSSKLVLWNMYGGNEFIVLEGHSDDITTIEFSHNNEFVATASKDKTIKVWSTITGELVQNLKVYTMWHSIIRFSADDKYIATQNEESTFKVWNLATGRAFKKYRGHSGRLSCFEFLPDGKHIVSGAWDKTVRIWDIKTAVQINVLKGMEHPVNSIAISTDGKTMAVGGGDQKYGIYYYPGIKKIALWDLGTNTMKYTIDGPENGSIIQMDFSNDGKYLITRTDLNNRFEGWEVVDIKSTSSQIIDIWDLNTKSSIISFNGNFNNLKELFAVPNHYFYGDEYNNFHLVNLITKSVVKTFKGHTAPITNIQMSFDSTYVLSRSTIDGMIKFWDLKNTNDQLSYIYLGGENNEYLVYSNDNYYMCSKRAASSVHFVRNYDVYEFEQFDIRYNRPDMIMKKMKSTNDDLIQTYYKAYQKRLKKMDLVEENLTDELHLPKLKIDKTNIPLTTKAATLNFVIEANDEKYALNRINVYINDVPLYGSNGLDLKLSKSKKHIKSMSIELNAGMNRIKVNCMNEKGVESLSEFFEVFYDANIVPNLYVLTIGVSKFKDEQMNLKYAAKDANDIIQLFKSKYGVFKQVYQYTVVNEKATKENILALKSKLANATPNDIVILMVSSHGVLDQNLDYFIATYDMDFNNPVDRGLSYEALESILDNIKPRKKILLMDACHSGEVDKEEVTLETKSEVVEDDELVFRSFPNTSVKKIGLENSFELMKELFSDLRRGSGATVISSAGGAEYAIEGDQWNNGVFTYCFIEGLKDLKADQNNDGIVSLVELEKYLLNAVPQMTNGRQKPTFRAENNNNDFILWK